MLLLFWSHSRGPANFVGLLHYLHLGIYKKALQMWRPRTRQRKGCTPSTPDDKRKKHLLEIYDFHAV